MICQHLGAVGSVRQIGKEDGRMDLREGRGNPALSSKTALQGSPKPSRISNEIQEQQQDLFVDQHLQM